MRQGCCRRTVANPDADAVCAGITIAALETTQAARAVVGGTGLRGARAGARTRPRRHPRMQRPLRARISASRGARTRVAPSSATAALQSKRRARRSPAIEVCGGITAGQPELAAGLHAHGTGLRARLERCTSRVQEGGIQAWARAAVGARWELWFSARTAEDTPRSTRASGRAHCVIYVL